MKNKYHIGQKKIVRKGEIACYKQFLLFSQCFPQPYISLVCQNAALCGNGFTDSFTNKQINLLDVQSFIKEQNFRLAQVESICR